MTPAQVRDLIARVRRNPDDFEGSVARLDSFLRGVIVGASGGDGGEQWYRHVRNPATVDALCDGALRVCDGMWLDPAEDAPRSACRGVCNGDGSTNDCSCPPVTP